MAHAALGADPDTPRVAELRSDVAELNAFFAKQTLTPPTITTLVGYGYSTTTPRATGGTKVGHLFFSLKDRPVIRTCPKRSRMRANSRGRKFVLTAKQVVEIDISSSYLTIFYSLCDERLDPAQNTYAGYLGRLR